MSPKLSAAEWDFRNVPEDEVTACYFYEFGREVPEVRARIKELRGTTSADQYEEFLKIVSGYYRGGCQFFLWYPEWPGKPYLQINKTIRERRIGLLGHNKLSDAELAAWLRPLPIPVYLEGIDPSTMNQTKIEIVIRPWLTHDELKRGFATLLKLDFPIQGKAGGRRLKPQGRAGGLNPKKHALKALGVYRLRKNQSAREVLELLESTDSRQFPAEVSAVRRVQAKAKGVMASFKRDMLESLVEGGYVDIVVQCGHLMHSSIKAIAAAKEGKISPEDLDKIRESLLPDYPGD